MREGMVTCSDSSCAKTRHVRINTTAATFSNRPIITPRRCAAIALLGPTGCGKSAAAYAVAQELGYRVLEVNATLDRTAGTLGKLVGEAMQSKRLAHGPRRGGSAAGGGEGGEGGAEQPQEGAGEAGSGEGEEDEAPAKPAGGRGRAGQAAGKKGGAAAAQPAGRKRRAASNKGAPAAFGADGSDGGSSSGSEFQPSRKKRAASGAPRPGPGAAAARCGRGGGVNPWIARALGASAPSDAAGSEPGTPADASPRRGATPATQGTPAAAAAAATQSQQQAQQQQPRAQSLVLFDEADVLLCHDRGFVSALPPLIRSARCPIVLVFGQPAPPAGLEGLPMRRVELRAPGAGDLLRLLALVCVAEGVPAGACQLAQLQGILGSQVRACWWRKGGERCCGGTASMMPGQPLTFLSNKPAPNNTQINAAATNFTRARTSAPA
jgi:hypothetical protein